MTKEAQKFSEELGMELELSHLRPFCRSQRDPHTVIISVKVKQHLRRTVREKIKEKIKENWQWHFVCAMNT